MAMAAANAVCDVIMEPGFLDRVGKVAKSLWARLDDLVEKYPGVIEEIRGSGLMIGIKCVGDSADFRGKLHEAGLLSVGAAENVIRLLPPLIIEQHHIDEAIGVLSAVCAKIEEDG